MENLLKKGETTKKELLTNRIIKQRIIKMSLIKIDYYTKIKVLLKRTITKKEILLK